MPSDSAACGQDSGSRSMQPSSTLIFSSASFLCCYTWSISSKSYGDGFSWATETGSGWNWNLWPARRRLWIDGRRGLGPEWQTSPAAFRVTEQPCSGSALLTSHEKRKGGPNIAHSTFPGRLRRWRCPTSAVSHRTRRASHSGISLRQIAHQLQAFRPNGLIDYFSLLYGR